MEKADRDLVTTLRSWRTATWKQDFSDYGGSLYGARALMSDQILQRFVALAHAGATNSVEQLGRDVPWCHMAKYGDKILAILRNSQPSTGIQTEATTDSRASIPVAPKQRKCGICSKLGHNRALCFNISVVYKCSTCH